MPGVTMDVGQVALVVRSLRGSPITVLFAMIVMPDLHSEADIAGRTGFSRKTVRSALGSLEELGFVQRNGRYEAWILTARARQMVLGETRDDEDTAIEASNKSDGYILPLASSSSSSDSSHDVESDPETTTTDEGQKVPLPPEGTEGAFDVLLRLGCSPSVAVRSLAKSLVQWSEDQVCAEADAWCAYCASPAGNGIRAPGFLVARRLSAGVAAPEVREVSDRERRERETAAYLEAAWTEIVRH